MRHASTYRGARRNAARGASPFESVTLRGWRKGSYAADANEKAKLNERAVQADNASKAASKALVEAGILGFKRRADVVLSAFIAFYQTEKPTRSVSRIMRELTRQKRAA